MMKKVILLFGLGILVLIGIYAYSIQTMQPHGVMKGTITAVQPAAPGGTSLGTILVEGKYANNPADKASVTITQQTKLLAKDDTTIQFEDLKVGSNVEVLFTGPVLESYPVQFAAAKVIVQ